MTHPKKVLDSPQIFLTAIFFCLQINHATSSNWYRFYYPHRSRELVSPVCSTTCQCTQFWSRGKPCSFNLSLYQQTKIKDNIFVITEENPLKWGISTPEAPYPHEHAKLFLLWWFTCLIYMLWSSHKCIYMLPLRANKSIEKACVYLLYTFNLYTKPYNNALIFLVS